MQSKNPLLYDDRGRGTRRESCSENSNCLSSMHIAVPEAGAIYGLYTAMVYLALPGGWIADKILTARRAVLYGGIIMAASSSR